MFGVGFRNGFTQESFVEDAPFGKADTAQRNAFAAGYDATGTLVDVSNNVGKTHPAFPVFEAVPFAIGTSTQVAAGEWVPAGTVVDFELNLQDPFVVRYLQESCHRGRLRCMLTSLQTSGFGGAPAWAEFHTRDSVLGDPPSLTISGTVVRPDDTDGDRLPDDWERHYFGSLATTGTDDPDLDLAPTFAEMEAGTHPDRHDDVLVSTIGPISEEDGIRIRFRHAPSREYRLQASADIVEWSDVSEAVLTYRVGQGWAEFLAPTSAPTPARYYRVEARSAAATGLRP